MKALLMDFGGVLTTSIFTSFAAFFDKHEIDVNHARDVMRAAAEQDGEGIIHLIERGEITEEEFNRRLAEQLSEGAPQPVPAEDLKVNMFAGTRPDTEMLNAVDAIRQAGFKTGLLSNSWGGASDYPQDLLKQLFDAVVISGEVGLRKPDPAIYELAAESVESPAGECVFVDDLPRNVRGAESVGMTAIHHRTAAKTIPELEKLFSVSLTTSA